VRLIAAALVTASASTSSPGCGRIGYDAVEDADLVDAVEDADLVDAPEDSAGCTSSATCGALRACVVNQCVPAHRVFLSSTQHDAALGGLAAADAICQSLADAALLGGTWRAWLSGSMIHASQRVTQAVLPYRRTDGVPIADNWDDLIDGTLASPISVDETGTELPPNSEVWTGSNFRGQKTLSTCNDWTTNVAGATYGTVGLSAAVDATWTDVYLQFCNRTNVRLYCFEQ
jgi:hypothetical protein